MRILVLPLVLATALGGCAPNLRPPANNGNRNPDGGSAGDGGTGGGGNLHVVNRDDGGGVTTTQVDARQTDAWVYLSLAGGNEVSPATPATSPDWDLAFQRFKIKVNGGVSGSGNVAVAALPGADFAALTTAPAGGYASDVAAGDESDGLVFEAGDGWYAYDIATHVLTARPVLFVVRAVGGLYYKVEIKGYYDAAGTPGYLSYRWAKLAAPPASDAITVDATSSTAWTYVSVKAGGVVAVSAPESSKEWDLAVQRTQLRTNSGTSGGGLGGAQAAAAGLGYDGLARSPTVGFVADVMLPIPGPPGSGETSTNPALAGWYDYDPATHAVSPKAQPFLVRTAAGDYAKLLITAYADGVYTLRLAPLVRSVDEQTLAVDAASATAWVYVSLRAGAVVTVADPLHDGSWDLALLRTQLATNSGTSGGGSGGAADPMVAGLGDIVSASMAAYQVDSELPLPGPPGSGTFSGSSILNGWYDYDLASHAVTPKVKAFLVHGADGGCTKLQIAGWSDGKFTLRWAYAGPGRTDF
jgi:heme-binding HmuY-like protein